MEVDKPQILNGFISQPNAQYVIPIYQRNYVWKKENINQLLEDIENMINVDGNSKTYHFFGTVVFIETLSNGFFHEYTIIDGQQRLTTVFLILQAMKQVYPESVEIIDESYLFNRAVPGTTQHQRYRLKPLVSDDDMYQKISDNNLENLTEKEQNSNLYMRFLQIKKRVETWSQKYNFGTILTAIDRLKIVWIKLDKNEEPQQVFESINSTGVNLTAADLIRNFVLMNKDDATQTEIYNEYWSKIEFIHVKTENLKEFFRSYISIKKKNTISEREVYDLFKTQYSTLCENVGSEKVVLKDILNYSEIYGYIKYQDSPIKKSINSETIDEAIKEFRNTRSTMPLIVVMETIKLYRENKISEDDVVKSIKLISNYMIRRNVCGEDTRYISASFGHLLGRVLKYFKQSGNYFESITRALVNDNIGIGPYMPNDAIIREQFQKSNLYNRDLTAFVLKKIENNASRIPYDQLNIEHVMPQTKSKSREDKINAGSAYEEVVDRIGNLTLVDFKDNSSMGNKDFESKKKILHESKHIKMNEYILDSTQWNEDEISKRGDMLADEFIKIFPYPELPKDLPLVVNINEDDEDVFKKAKKGLPTDVSIGSDDSYAVSSWDEVYKKIMEYFYKKDHDKFLNSFDKWGDNPSKLRASYELENNVFIEINMDTISRLRLLQNILKKMGIEEHIRIVYTLDIIQQSNKTQGLFSDEEI